MQTLNTPPDRLSPWLTYTDFLTLKLKDTAGDAQLRVLNQEEIKTGWWDRYKLGISEPQVVLREILMLAWEHPCWYARTIIPLSTWQAHYSLFQGLNKGSLGHIIFNTGQVTRRWLINYEITPECIEFYWLPDAWTQGEKSLWVRLSCFSFNQGGDFYLIEILLPDLLRIGA